MAGFSGSSDLGMGVVFTLKDGFSKTSDKIEGKMKSLSGTAETQFRKFNKTLHKHKQTIATYGTAAIVSIGVAAGAAYNEFVKFDDSMADARKTVNLTASETDRLGNKILDMSKHTRTSIHDLTRMAAIGGQLGVGRDQIEGFTKSINILGVALGDDFPDVDKMTSTIGRLRNVMGDFKTKDIAKDLTNVGNALNSLGASSTATADGVAEISKRLLSQTANLKLASGDAFGLAATLQGAGVRAESAASGISMLLNKMGQDYEGFANSIGVSKERFKNLFNKDANKALKLFVNRIKDMDLQGTKAAEMFKDLGIQGTGTSQALGGLIKGLDTLEANQKNATESLKGTSSIMDEYNIKNENAAANIEKFKNSFRALIIQIGKSLKPIFGVLVGYLNNLINGFMDLWKSLSPFTKGFFKYLAVGVGLLVTGITGLTVAMTIAETAAWGFAASLLANPITWIVLGVLALVAGIIALEKEFEFLTKIWEGLKPAIMPVWNVFKDFWEFLKDTFINVWYDIRKVFWSTWNEIKTAFKPIIDMFGEANKEGGIMAGIGVVLETVFKALAWTVKQMITAWTFGFKIVANVLSVVAIVITKIIRKVVEMGVSIYNTFKSVGSNIVDFFTSIPSFFSNIGTNIISYLWGGIKKGWDLLVSGVKSLVSKLMDVVLGPFDKIGSFISDFFGGDAENNINLTENRQVTPAPVGGNGGHFVPPSSRTVVNNNNTTQNNNDNRPIIVKNIMDGDEISTRMIDKQELNNSRNR